MLPTTRLGMMCSKLRRFERPRFIVIWIIQQQRIISNRIKLIYPNMRAVVVEVCVFLVRVCNFYFTQSSREEANWANAFPGNFDTLQLSYLCTYYAITKRSTRTELVGLIWFLFSRNWNNYSIYKALFTMGIVEQQVNFRSYLWNPIDSD